MNLKQFGMALTVSVVVVATSMGVAVAQPDDGEGAPITGDALVKASQAALTFTGGGTVSASEVGDEDSLYEVEVTLGDGSQVDVQLDQNFVVVGAKNEAPGADTEPDGDGEQGR